MKKTYNLQDFIHHTDEQGYIPLKAFCNKVFQLNDYSIATSFFGPVNPYYFIKNEIEDIQKNIRNTVTILEVTKKRRGTGEVYISKSVQGGIYKDDLESFIEKAKQILDINNEKLVEAYNEHFKAK